MEVELTDAGKTWIQEHHPQGIIWEYDPDKPFKLHSMAAKFAELTYLRARASRTWLIAIILLIIGGGSLYFFLMPKGEDRAVLEVADFMYDEETAILTIWIENVGLRSALDVVVEFRMRGMIHENEIESGEIWSIWVDCYSFYFDTSKLPIEYEFALSYEWIDSKGEKGEFYPQLVKIEVTKDHIT